jgi:hypothetical protein
MVVIANTASPAMTGSCTSRVPHGAWRFLRIPRDHLFHPLGRAPMTKAMS